MSGPPDWAPLYRTCLERCKWDPEKVNNLTFCQMAAYAGDAHGKLVFKSSDDPGLLAAIAEYEAQNTPGRALARAEEMLEEVLRHPSLWVKRK